MEVMKGSGQGLMQQLASTVAAAQVSRSSQTVGTRFRDQLKDLITRLDQSAHLTLPVLLSPLGMPPSACAQHAVCACHLLHVHNMVFVQAATTTVIDSDLYLGRPGSVHQLCMLQAQGQLLSSKLVWVHSLLASMSALSLPMVYLV